MRKRTLVALVAGLAVFAGTFAFAATLGGLTTGQIGAQNVSVAACDADGVSSSYSSPTWDATDSRYEISTVTVSGVADTCDGSNLKVTLINSSNVSQGEGTLAIPTSVATSFAVPIGTPAAASAVTGVHVAIGS